MTLPDIHSSRAVLLGTSHYSDPDLTPIPAVTNNLTQLLSIFTSRSHWGLPAARCTKLADPVDLGSVASKIASIADDTTDTLLIYIAGHGLIAPTGELVLAISSTASRWPQFSGLRYSWIREALKSSPARRTVVIVDCCFSGRAITAMSAARSVVPGQVEIDGAYVLTATASNVTAIAPRNADLTSFTASLVDILRTGVPNDRKYIRLRDIYEFSRRSMIRSGGPQPMQMGTNQIGDLPLVRNLSAADAWTLVAAMPTDSSTRIATTHEFDGQTGILAISILNFEQLSALDQVDSHLVLLDIIQRAADRSRLDTTGWIRKPIRSGECIALPSSSGGGRAGHLLLIRELANVLRTRNMSQDVHHKLRLSLGVHQFSYGDTEGQTPGAYADSSTDSNVLSDVFDEVRAMADAAIWGRLGHTGEIEIRVVAPKETLTNPSGSPREHFDGWRMTEISVAGTSLPGSHMLAVPPPPAPATDFDPIEYGV